MDFATIFMNAAVDKRVLQQMSTSLVFSILSAIPWSILLLVQLLCLVILSPICCYLVISYVLVLVEN